jgi:hypothetical protein
MMNVVTDFAVFMNKSIYAHIMLVHTFLIMRLYYYNFIILNLIETTTTKPRAARYRRSHSWTKKYTMTYIIYALFNIPFFIWYEYSYGQYWYFSHFFYIHYHMYGISILITTFIHHKELKLTREHVLTFIFRYLVYMIVTGWLLFACVNGNDEGDWKGWSEEDLYRFNNIKKGSIDWREKPQA